MISTIWVMGVLPEESGEKDETFRAAAAEYGMDDDDAPLLQAARLSAAMRTRRATGICFNGKMLLFFLTLYAKGTT
jgi:hypothetical protein